MRHRVASAGGPGPVDVGRPMAATATNGLRQVEKEEDDRDATVFFLVMSRMHTKRGARVRADVYNVCFTRHTRSSSRPTKKDTIRWMMRED